MNSSKLPFLLRIAGAALSLLPLGYSAAVAQTVDPHPQAALVASASDSNLPDAPQQQAATATGQTSANNAYEGKQTKRILGIVPNFRAVSVDAKLKPMTVKEKFIGATEDSFDYSSLVFVAGLAGVDLAENSYPQFHEGAAGYARYYWHDFADQADENYWVEFILPSALHQDPRYYTLGRGGFVKRLGYSFSRIAITRQDDGHNTFNYSEVVGAGAAAGISSLYYPTVDRDWTKVGQRWATSVGLDGATFIVKEFWPDINSKIFHQKN